MALNVASLFLRYQYENRNFQNWFGQLKFLFDDNAFRSI